MKFHRKYECKRQKEDDISMTKFELYKKKKNYLRYGKTMDFIGGEKGYFDLCMYVYGNLYMHEFKLNFGCEVKIV
jgi:hypothetical protein